MEATGVYWHTPWQALTDAGIQAELLNAQQVKQLRGRKTDVEDSRWLARVCQFGLGRPSFVPSQPFRDLRTLSRHRRTLVARRSQVRNQVQKVIDPAGVRIGAVLTDIFGRNGRRILDGLVGRLPHADILASLSGNVRRKLAPLGDALGLELREPERLLLADLLSVAEREVLTGMTSWSYPSFFSHRRGDTPCHCRPVAAAPSTEKRSALCCRQHKVPEIGPPGSESGGRKRAHGNRTAARLRKHRMSHRSLPNTRLPSTLLGQ